MSKKKLAIAKSLYKSKQERSVRPRSFVLADKYRVVSKTLDVKGNKKEVKIEVPKIDIEGIYKHLSKHVTEVEHVFFDKRNKQLNKELIELSDGSPIVKKIQYSRPKRSLKFRLIPENKHAVTFSCSGEALDDLIKEIIDDNDNKTS